MDTSISVSDFSRWKDSKPHFEDCDNPERGMKTCIPSLSYACCRECYEKQVKAK